MYFSLPKQSKNLDLSLTLLHSERPKLLTILAFLGAMGLTIQTDFYFFFLKGTPMYINMKQHNFAYT